MTQDVTSAVLANKVAQIRAQAHIGDGGFVVTPLLDWQPLEKDKAFTVEQVFP
jgi:hypothetical protein